MHWTSLDDAAASDPGERMYAISVVGSDIIVNADVEENLNLDPYDDNPAHSYRIDVYGHADPTWELDPDLVADVEISAVGERRGEVGSGIEFAYEDEGDWDEYPSVYDCLFSMFGNVDEVAVISDPSEIFDLDDGDYIIMFEDDRMFL